MKHRTLVTGATRGIGRAICERLAQAGDEVVGLARSPDPGFPFELHLADLADQVSTAEALNAVLAGGVVDHLVNNAGLSNVASLEDVDLDLARKLWEVNIRAMIQCAQACTPGMLEKGRGRIVNISSRALLGRPRISIYASAKSAVNGLTTSWALEFATRGITVNAVAPGAVGTEMLLGNNPPGSDRHRALTGAIPMGRFGEPAEIAGAVAYFLSDEASYTTGQTLYVDGGWSFATI
jgi:NAD(P)-dependent dehydrogenase (short-subunit alcohol dehydrogenase family)